MNIKSVALSAFLFFPMMMQAVSDTQRQEAFLKELEAAKYALTFTYAPSEWKSEYLQWDVDVAFEEAKARMIEKGRLSIHDCQLIYREFFGSLKDYHVATIFYSTEWSAFPIVVKSVNGRYYITDFDFKISPSMSEICFPFDGVDFDRVGNELNKCQIGDEIIAINGMPIKNVIEQLIDDELLGNRTPTGYALAERMLFMRLGHRGHQIPLGDFTLTVKALHGKAHTVQLAWLHVPEWVTDPHSKKIGEKQTNSWQKLEKLLVKDFSVSLAKDMLKSPLSEIRPFDSYDDEIDLRPKSFVPPLGKILWETDTESDFYAYLYLNEQGKKIGYLYISNFVGIGEKADDYMNQLISIIERFEDDSEALVVDINNNPGGNLFYMYGILSLLTDKPLITPKNTETLIQEDIYSMAVIYNQLKDELENYDDSISSENSLSGYSVNKTVLNKIADYAKSILDQWNSGITRTDPDYIYGLDTIDPHPEVHYTKPILVLTNELDFSCGDFFPAILQDNQRATLFGKKTAGAGGYVRTYFQNSQFGVRLYSLTGSIAYRINGTVIENLGVSPDVPYDLTVRDLQCGFMDYKRSVNRQLYELIK